MVVRHVTLVDFRSYAALELDLAAGLRPRDRPERGRQDEPARGAARRAARASRRGRAPDAQLVRFGDLRRPGLARRRRGRLAGRERGDARRPGSRSARRSTAPRFRASSRCAPGSPRSCSSPTGSPSSRAARSCAATTWTGCWAVSCRRAPTCPVPTARRSHSETRRFAGSGRTPPGRESVVAVDRADRRRSGRSSTPRVRRCSRISRRRSPSTRRRSASTGRRSATRPIRRRWRRSRRASTATLARGTTSLGPHLRDVAIDAAGRDLRSFGSQGEQRSAVLSLVARGGRPDRRPPRGAAPLLLLDDVLSELDETAPRRAARGASGRIAQTIVTATGPRTRSRAAGPSRRP